jgi:hypothetical protein
MFSTNIDAVDDKQPPKKGKYRSAVSNPDDDDFLKTHFQKMKEVTPSTDFDKPIKLGKYEARVADARFCKVGVEETPAIKVCFKIVEGEYQGRHVWKSVWLTDRALPFTKRELEKIGIIDSDDLNSPELKTYLCEIRVVVNENNYNDVKSFKVIGRCDAVPVHSAFPPVCDSSKED